MWRKLNYCTRVIVNFVRVPLLYVFSLAKIRISILQKISFGTIFSIGLNGKILIGKSVTIESGTLVRASRGKIKIGNKVYINRNCTIVANKEINIDSGTTIGPNVCIYDHDHDLKHRGNFICEKIEIGKNVWIGANVIILKGVCIGDNSIVAASSVVSKNIPEKSIYKCKIVPEIIKIEE